MAIKLAQTFYIDKTMVKDSEHVTIDSISLYFKSVPRDQGNRSGIAAPGVTVYICETSGDDVPDLTKIYETGIARREYNEINASADASIATPFHFNNPLILTTNKSYAIAVAYDGNEEYTLWDCREGQTLVGTNTTTSGANARNVGKYYEYTLSDGIHWKCLNNVDLKFSVVVCQYAANTNPGTYQTTYLLPSGQVEFIMYNRYHPGTLNRTALKIGEMAFQETPVIYGSVSVNNQSTIIKSTNNINFSTIFPSPSPVVDPSLSDDPVLEDYRYIVLRNGSSQSAQVDVVRVTQVISNTQLQLERLPVFSNNVATFSITAAGQVDDHNRHFHTGRWFDYTTNTFVRHTAFNSDIVRLINSNANSTVRFTNNCVQSITISSGGTGYSNSDTVTVYPTVNANTANSQHISYIEAYANATANVVTNGAGTITGISITNAGWGLTSNVNLSITTSGGTTANLVPSIGSTIRGAVSNAQLSDTAVTSMPVHRTYPNLRVISNQAQGIQYIQHLPFYVYPNYEHIVNQATPAYNRIVHPFQNSSLIDVQNNDTRILVIPSFSILQKKAANVSVTLANTTVQATQVKCGSILEMSITSTNPYSLPVVSGGHVYNYSYVINNDLTGETKGQGAAMARHVSEKVTFADGRNAEDVAIYCDVYKPIGTNVTAYARLHNRSDQEAFDDKDWTQLVLTSNNASYTSSLTNENDIIELSFALPNCPPSVNTIAGYCTTTNGQANVVGIGTAWNTDLQVNDVVKIYDQLFPSNYMISVVRAVANSTQITLDDTVTDTSIFSGTCKVDLIGRPASGANTEIGYPFQAFTYKPNHYVCRYYDSAMSKHDTYNTFQVKLVLTSNNDAIVPKVWNTRAVGVSA
jgi:hypothetical protein